MDNLFPYFQSFAVDGTETNTCRGESGWAPQSSIDQSKLQYNKKLLAGKGHRSKTLSDKKSPRRPRPAPNDRDASFVLEELSPLCEAERGIPDPVHVACPKVAKVKHRQTKEEERDELKVILNVYNRLPISHEIFSHSRTTVHSIELKEADECFRLAGSLKPQSVTETAVSNVFPILLSTPTVASVFMSARQEIKAFHFNPGPIGMVVEIKGTRLLCTKVMPGSQCSFHEQALVGSEIIAVNGARVLTLQSFLEEIRKAQVFTDRFIDITVSAFRGGRMKLDDMLSFSKKNKKMTSLLGNMFTKGIDKDHSHGIELPTAESSDESDEEDAPTDAPTDDPDGNHIPDLFDPEPENRPEAEEKHCDIERAVEDVVEQTSTNQSDTGDFIEESSVQFSRRNSRLKGPVIDDNSSMGSSTKKKFMEVYRGDSDDDSIVSKPQDGDVSVDITEANSMDIDDDGQDAFKEDLDVCSDIIDTAGEECPVSPVVQAGDMSRDESNQDLACAPAGVEDSLVKEQSVESISEHKITSEDIDSDDDDVEIDEAFAAKIKQQGIVDALEEIATGEEVPVVLEEEPVEEESDEESEPGDVWDYATVLEGQDYSPYRCLVCMPTSLEKSKNGWGNPQSFLHFANFSTEWYLEVFWVDHESLLVPRVKLRSGERHNEMTSSELVWCIIATYVDKKSRRKRALIEDDAESVGADSGLMVPGKSNVIMLFKGSSSVLTNVRSSFLSWIPWYSLTFSQRSRLTFNTEKNKELDDAIDPPHLNIHIFDRHHKDS